MCQSRPHIYTIQFYQYNWGRTKVVELNMKPDEVFDELIRRRFTASYPVRLFYHPSIKEPKDQIREVGWQNCPQDLASHPGQPLKVVVNF